MITNKANKAQSLSSSFLSQSKNLPSTKVYQEYIREVRTALVHLLQPSEENSWNGNTQEQNGLCKKYLAFALIYPAGTDRQVVILPVKGLLCRTILSGGNMPDFPGEILLHVVLYLLQIHLIW